MDPRAPSRTGALRALVAASATGGSAIGLGRLAAGASTEVPAPDALVGTVVLALGALAAAVLTVGCAMLAATSCAATAGRRWTRTEAVAARLVPVLLRRMLALGLGASLTVGLGTTALADEIDVGWAVTTGSATQVPTPAPSPADAGPAGHGHVGVAAPTVAVSAPAVTTPDAAAPEAPALTAAVQAGDSLWSITAGLLPAGCDDARIAAAWPLLYAANRDVVGPDPGLIHPGDVLVVPAEVTA